MYKAKTGTYSFDLESTAEGILVNGESFSWDQVQIGEEYFHVIHNHKSYRAVVVNVDKLTKKLSIRINNSIYEVALQDRFDLLLEKMGMNSGQASRLNFIKAPMPGLIVDLRVKEGDKVNVNDPLIVLEAMKMENIIKSPGAGTVKSIRVEKGESVEKSQILIEF
ncbi:MAG TPA: acetyl-CoA carboxylase biotin carboxyl carrier protein subunit [Cyclobacteriaceae bacterium]|nr:acetyl-CoA carboxylase biotin carboxyl carrier protein subunit [Cyclobacteriaceae bacterium]